MADYSDLDFTVLAGRIKQWGRELGFQQVGIADTDLAQAEHHLQHWLAKGFQGDMTWMARHGSKRTRPGELVPGTLRVISVRMDYLPDEPDPAALLQQPATAFISRYALGRDYHRCCARACRSWQPASRTRSGRSVTGPLSTPPR